MAKRKAQPRTDEMRAKDSARHREKRRRWAEAGLCTKCGKEEADAGYKTCLLCRMDARDKWQLQKADENQKRRKPYKNRAKEIRAQRRAKDLCTYCGKHKPDAGYTLCKWCRAKSRRAYRRRREASGAMTKERMSNGLYCACCGAEGRAPGRTVCEKCLKRLQNSASRNFGGATQNNRSNHFRMMNNIFWASVRGRKKERGGLTT